MRQVIIDHFMGLGFWKDYWDQDAVVIVGSSVREMNDEFSDVDIVALVDAEAWSPIYEHYRREIGRGNIRVMNPAALKYDEFPLTSIEGVPGHYKVEKFEDLEERVEEFDDIARWIHGSSLVLHDPTNRYANVQKLCSGYPEDVWRSKLSYHYLEAYGAASNASNQLRRNQREAVILTMANCVSHLLKLCCLMDRRPFPYDKWLYQEAMNTKSGIALRSQFEQFFEEHGQPEIRRVEVPTYERPGHRNADLEEYPLFDVWRTAKRYFDELLPIKEKGD